MHPIFVGVQFLVIRAVRRSRAFALFCSAWDAVVSAKHYRAFHGPGPQRDHGDGRTGRPSRRFTEKTRGRQLRRAVTGYTRGDGLQVATRWEPALLADYLPGALTLADLRLEPSASARVLIRDASGEHLPLPAAATEMARQMADINEWLRGLPLKIEGDDAPAWVHAPDRSWRLATIETAHHLELIRLFNDSHEKGGRMLGGFWINRPKAWRFERLRLAGERIAECDFREMNLRLAYRHHGIAWPFAADECGYTAGDGGRPGFKAITNARLQAECPFSDSAERANVRAQFPPGTKLAAVRAAIEVRHAPLAAAGAFESGLGARLTRAESDLMVAVLLECRRRGLPSLPVHDCLCVPSSRANEAAAVMEELAERVTGAMLPVGITHGVTGTGLERAERATPPESGQSVPSGTVPA